MAKIRRFGEAKRSADVIVHNGTAYWVEIAETPTLDARGQIGQVLGQIDATLTMLDPWRDWSATQGEEMAAAWASSIN